LRQWESRYAIRAGRNFVVIPSFEGDRLCLHLCDLPMIQTMEHRRCCREPAYCPSYRFATPSIEVGDATATGASPRRDQSLRGHTVYCMRQRASHGITRRLLSRPCGRDSRCGLRRYERVFTWDHSHAGQISYPTRNFAERCYNRSGYCAGSAGRTFPPTSSRRREARTISSSRRIHDETVGVWSLRILRNSDGFR
jgi:hypothetical protein